jgi:DNA-binding MarR family transcriptional regulator
MKSDYPERLLACVGGLLQLFIVSEERFPSAEGRMRYNPLDFQTLRYIDANPESQGADIARAFGVAPTTQQSVLDRLIRKGLIVRSQHPSNRRARLHSLTPAGKDLRQAIHRQDMTNMKTMLAPLNTEEQTDILRLLEKVVVGLR